MPSVTTDDLHGVSAGCIELTEEIPLKAAQGDIGQQDRPVFAGRSLSISLFLLPLALLLSFVAAGPGRVPGDLAITQFIQDQIPGQLAWLFESINVIGSTSGAIVVTVGLTLVLGMVRRFDAAAVVFLTLPLRLVNSVLKIIDASPRPPSGLVRVTEQADGFGFPSGHTMGATILYGVLLILATRHIHDRPLRLVAQSVCLVMIVLAGVSRIYVGAHWPSDVAGGYLWGGLLIIALYSAYGRLLPIINRHIPAGWRGTTDNPAGSLRATGRAQPALQMFQDRKPASPPVFPAAARSDERL